MRLPTIALLSVSALLGCRGAPVVSPVAARAAPIVSHRPPLAAAAGGAATDLTCSFHWRRGVDADFDRRDQAVVRMRAPGDGRAVTLGDMSVRVALDDSVAGGARLLVALDAGTLRIDDDYDFGAAAFPANAGHGFTGLHYVSHPSSGSELQYTCSSGAAEAHAVAAVGGVMQCEAVFADVEGTNELLELDPRGADPFRGTRASTTVGGFDVGIAYQPGTAYDSGSVSLSLGDGRGGVHVAHPLVPATLPQNLFHGSHGFTGRTTLRHVGAGPELTYGCWTAARA